LLTIQVGTKLPTTSVCYSKKQNRGKKCYQSTYYIEEITETFNKWNQNKSDIYIFILFYFQSEKAVFKCVSVNLWWCRLFCFCILIFSLPTIYLIVFVTCVRKSVVVYHHHHLALNVPTAKNAKLIFITKYK